MSKSRKGITARIPRATLQAFRKVEDIINEHALVINRHAAILNGLAKTLQEHGITPKAEPEP